MLDVGVNISLLWVGSGVDGKFHCAAIHSTVSLSCLTGTRMFNISIAEQGMDASLWSDEEEHGSIRAHQNYSCFHI